MQFTSSHPSRFKLKCSRNISNTTDRRKANLFGHILARNCLLKHIIEGNIEGSMKVTGGRGRRCKHLLDDLKETGRYLN